MEEMLASKTKLSRLWMRLAWASSTLTPHLCGDFLMRTDIDGPHKYLNHLYMWVETVKMGKEWIMLSTKKKTPYMKISICRLHGTQRLAQHSVQESHHVASHFWGFWSRLCTFSVRQLICIFLWPSPHLLLFTLPWESAEAKQTCLEWEGCRTVLS